MDGMPPLDLREVAHRQGDIHTGLGREGVTLQAEGQRTTAPSRRVERNTGGPGNARCSATSNGPGIL